MVDFVYFERHTISALSCMDLPAGAHCAQDHRETKMTLNRLVSVDAGQLPVDLESDHFRPTDGRTTHDASPPPLLHYVFHPYQAKSSPSYGSRPYRDSKMTHFMSSRTLKP